MKGNADVVKILNEVLSAELTGINQYFIHAMMCANWRYGKLAAHAREESIEEMKHAQEVIERILYLEGRPNMDKYMKINVGSTVPQQHEYDLSLEKDAQGNALLKTMGIRGFVAVRSEWLRRMEGTFDAEEKK